MQRNQGKIETRVRGMVPVIPLLASFSILITILLKTAGVTIIIISELSRLFQSPIIRSQLDNIMAFRSQEQFALENLSQRFLTGEWGSLEIDARHLTFGAKLKYILVAAVTDVSAIVPTWNEEKCLPNCLRSLNDQRSRAPFEIIVVDGGSTDKTTETAGQYADRIVVKPHQPVGAARNTGAREASGKILAFIDADTMASKNWLDTIINAFEARPDAAGVTGPTLPYEGTTLDKRLYDVATGWFQRFSVKLGLPHVAGFNCAYRNDAFWKAGGFDETRQLSEDIMLSLRIRHQGPILFNSEMLAYTSLRRIKTYGYTYLTTYYLMNWATMLFLKRTLGYPKVR